LLLNHLAIDSQGRIVFDSSDDAGDASGEGQGRQRKGDIIEEEEETEPDSMIDSTAKNAEEDEEDVEIDVGALGTKFFPSLDLLDEQDICPSLKNFDLGDPSGTMDVPFLKAPEDWRDKDKPAETSVGDKSGIFLDDDNPVGFDDDDDGLLGNFDIPADTGFGEGGEAWARDAAIETRMRVHDGGFDNDGMGGADGEDGDGAAAGAFDPETGEYVVSLDHSSKVQGGHDDILSYFDEALQKNWAGPEHWRIRKIKDINKPATATKVRKEKELFEIDFLSPLSASLAETIYTPASSSTVISLPKKDWKSKTRNLLPDDKHFNSKQLLRLFLKPKARMGSRRSGLGMKTNNFGQRKEEEAAEGDMDEAFWAQNEGPAEIDDAPQGDYDANFFQDDGLPMPGGLDDDDDIEFADARDHFSPGAEERGEGGMAGINSILNGGMTQLPEGEEGAFGTQLVTQSRRMRPEYVQYARVAKKVDVRRLKEELWKGMGIEALDLVSGILKAVAGCTPLTFLQNLPSQTPGRLPTPQPEPQKGEDGSLKFTSVMQNLQNVYPKQAMNDISTSYCFICLLHLANEKGLVIEKQEGLMELDIRKDPTAEITVGGWDVGVLRILRVFLASRTDCMSWMKNNASNALCMTTLLVNIFDFPCSTIFQFKNSLRLRNAILFWMILMGRWSELFLVMTAVTLPSSAKVIKRRGWSFGAFLFTANQVPRPSSATSTSTSTTYFYITKPSAYATHSSWQSKISSPTQALRPP